MSIGEKTFLSTELGLISIGSLPPLNQEGWQALDLMAHTGTSQDWITGLKSTGNQPLLNFTTKKGYVFSGDPDHLIIAINKSGKPAWRRLKQIEFETKVLFQTDTYPLVTKYEYNPPTGFKDIITPKILDTKLCEFLGYFFINGIVAENDGDLVAGVLINRIDDGRILEFIKDSITYLFGMTLFDWNEFKSFKSKYVVYGFEQAEFVDYIKKIGLLTDKPQIPELIWCGGREYIYAFLRGAFTASMNSNPKEGLKISTPFIETTRDLQQLMLSIGLVTAMGSRFNKMFQAREYTLHVLADYKQVFKQRISFLDSIQRDNFLSLRDEDALSNVYVQHSQNEQNKFEDVVEFKSKSKGKTYGLQIRENQTFVGNGLIHAVD